jgi:hypothetical protein
VSIEAKLRRAGKGKRLVIENGAEAEVNAGLAAMIGEAFAIRTRLLSGSDDSIEVMTERLGIGKGRLTSLVRLSYLAPDMVRALLEGRQPIELTPNAAVATELERAATFPRLRRWNVHNFRQERSITPDPKTALARPGDRSRPASRHLASLIAADAFVGELTRVSIGTIPATPETENMQRCAQLRVKNLPLPPPEFVEAVNYFYTHRMRCRLVAELALCAAGSESIAKLRVTLHFLRGNDPCAERQKRRCKRCGRSGSRNLARRRFSPSGKPPIPSPSQAKCAFASKRAASISQTLWAAWASIQTCLQFRSCPIKRSADASMPRARKSIRVGSAAMSSR